MSDEIPTIGTGKSGRPTLQDSLDIDRVIRDCYILGLYPAYVVQKTGLNKNTVYTKYKELEDEVKAMQATDKDDDKERRRSQHTITLDDLIARTNNMLMIVEEHVESYRKKDAEIPQVWLHKFTDLIKILMNMQQKKAPRANSTTKITYGPDWIRDA